MTIIFYSMGSACGFCVKAESLLKPHIQNGNIIKKSASEAKGKFNGFPAFESTKTKKTSTGLPKSYEDLANKLGHTSEGFHDVEIIFYSMGNRCGHCVNAEKNILNKQIADGKIQVLPASQAPSGKFNGFPAFVSKVTGKSTMGAPKSYEDLVNKLGHKTEHYSHSLDKDMGHRNPYHYNAIVQHMSPHRTPLHLSCNPPPHGMTPIECCEYGGRSGTIGQCPTGCVDEAGECIPSNKRKTCTSFSCPPKHGHIANIGGECACGTGHAKSYNTLQECCDDVNDSTGLCDEYNCKKEGSFKEKGTESKPVKKKKMSELELALIILAAVGLLGLIGFLIYRARK